MVELGFKLKEEILAMFSCYSNIFANTMMTISTQWRCGPI